MLVGPLALLLALVGMTVTATACEGVGGPELTTLTTSLSGEGKEGTTITVLEGSKVKDKATLKGKNASSATGKVTYKVYSNSECKTLVTTAGEVTVSGESVPASSEKELEAGASYYWQAHYSGDSKNAESTSECTEISSVKAKTSLTTKLAGEGKESEELTVLEGTKAKDKATLTGIKSSSAGGKVVYKIFSDKECKTLVKEAGEVTVSSGSVPASSEEELEGGKVYYWQATYKGDSLHQESTSSCGSEVLKVKAKTTLRTKLSGESKEGEELTVLEGTKANDKATVEGANSSSAEGKVIYKIYSDNKCEDLVAEAGEKSVSSGSASASNEEEFEGGAAYYWQATYKGDSLHQESTSSCGKEILKDKAKTSLSTALSGEGKEGAELSTLEGAKAKDDATLTGANSSSAGGDVVYDVYSDSECKDLVASAGEELVAFGSVPTSGELELEGGKTYYWQAHYGGDALHQESTSPCGGEVLTIKASTSVTTVLSNGGEEEAEQQIEVEEGTTVSDAATLHGKGASKAGGKVTYRVYSDSECKELVKEAGEASVSGGDAAASSGQKLGAGIYYWQAEYHGDSLDESSTSACGVEVLTVRGRVTVSTSLSSGEHKGASLEVEEDAGVDDTATLTGPASAVSSGTVEYKLYSDSECKELVGEAGTFRVTDGEVPSSDQLTPSAGKYYWQAIYSGDDIHYEAESTCGSEVEVVHPAALTTKLSGEGNEGTEIEVQGGAKVSDSATLDEESFSTATGTVTYKVYSDESCEELYTTVGEVSVSEGHVPSSPSVELPPGTYYWQASYSGDMSHPEAAGECGSEVETVADSASLSTSLVSEGGSGETVETLEEKAVHDTATLSGTKASEADGIVEYDVYSDAKCEEEVEDAGEVSVEKGEIPPSNDVTLKEGTYYWQAHYYGEPPDQNSTSSCGKETEIVKAPAITTSLSSGEETGGELEVQEGNDVSDRATLHEDPSTATGSIKYAIYSDPECKELVRSAGESSFTEGKVPASSEEELPEGTFYWQATYSGDGTHAKVTERCGGEVEKVVAQKKWIVSVGDSYISGEGGRWAGNTTWNTRRASKMIDALPNRAYSGAPNGEGKNESIRWCHRSKSAEIFIGEDLGKNVVNGKNLACSGAETASVSEGALVFRGLLGVLHVLREGAWKPGLDFVNVKKGELINKADPKKGKCALAECKGQAQMLEEFAAQRFALKESIPMVAISIGGNDFQFGPIVRNCVLSYEQDGISNFLLGDECNKTQQKELENRLAGVEVAVEEGINNIGLAMKQAGYANADFKLLVQDYPTPIPEAAGFRYAERTRIPPGVFPALLRRSKIGGCPFTDVDATWANKWAVNFIDEAVRKAEKKVAGVVGGYKVVFMELEHIFNSKGMNPGRLLCEKSQKLVGEKGGPKDWKVAKAVDESEWINQVRFWTGLFKNGGIRPFYQQEDFHPNYWGQLALRSCLRQAYKNGAPTGGECTIEGAGLTAAARGELPVVVKEPLMEFK